MEQLNAVLAASQKAGEGDPRRQNFLARYRASQCIDDTRDCQPAAGSKPITDAYDAIPILQAELRLAALDRQPQTEASLDEIGAQNARVIMNKATVAFANVEITKIIHRLE